MSEYPRITLASQSPRRKQLLSEAGFQFVVQTVEFDEVFPKELPANEVAEYLAKGKNDAHRSVLASDIIITADTVVISSGCVLGKPTDREDAISTLRSLSGKTHKVVSGVCISSLAKTICFSDTTEVRFHTLSEEEIGFYVDHYKPYDKAGSYGIQEWIGLIGVDRIKGSYFNVVGLPIDKVYQCLKNDFEILPARM